MKRILLGLNLLGCAASLLAQGTLQFGNTFSGVFRAPIYGCDPVDPFTSKTGQSANGIPTGTIVYNGPLLQGTGYTMALFAGPQGTSEPALAMVASTTFRTATGNVLPGGLINTMLVAVPGVSAGSIATLQVRVWDNQRGTVNSWAAVLASPSTARGNSAVFSSQPLGGSVDPNSPPVLPPAMTGWSSFQIYCVPEPSVLALATLGFGALLRRKRKST